MIDTVPCTIAHSRMYTAPVVSFERQSPFNSPARLQRESSSVSNHESKNESKATQVVGRAERK